MLQLNLNKRVGVFGHGSRVVCECGWGNGLEEVERVSECAGGRYEDTGQGAGFGIGYVWSGDLGV